MKKLAALIAATLASVALAAPANAEDWRFSITPYLWLPGFDGSIGARPGTPPTDVDAEFDSVFDQFEGAFMLKGEAQYGRLIFLGDIDYVAISGSKNVLVNNVLPIGGNLEVDTIDGSLLVGYRAVDFERLTLDAFAGARYSSLNIEAEANLGAIQFHGEQDKDWWDPVIGGRANYSIGDNGMLTFYGDVGGFGVSSELVWQAYLGYGYRITDNIVLLGGYRHYAVDYEDDELIMDIAISGPILGASFIF